MITGDKIKEARTKHNLTQERLAELTNYSVGHISRMEQNKYLNKINKILLFLAAIDLINIQDDGEEK